MNLLFCGVKGQVSNVECAGGQQILLLLISASPEVLVPVRADLTVGVAVQRAKPAPHVAVTS